MVVKSVLPSITQKCYQNEGILIKPRAIHNENDNGL